MQVQRRHISAFFLGTIGIFLLAFLLRIVVCGELAATPAVANPPEVTDMATYKSLALAIRNGDWPAFFDYQPFYYTVLLPVAFCFSPSGGVWPVLLLQALLGAATCVLAALSARRLFGAKAGWLAGILLALSRYHIFYTPFLLLEVPFAFCTALVLYAALRLMDDFSWKWSTALGIACSGALLTRGNALLWVPGLLALIFWRGWRERRAVLVRILAVFLLAFLIPILPYSIRNTLAKGRLCGASVAGGKVLSLGNSPEAPAGGLEYPRTYFAWNEDEEEGRRSVIGNIARWAMQEPAAFLELEARSLLLFWDHVEIPNNVSLEVQGRDSRLLAMPFLLPWGLLGALGLAGLLLCFSVTSPSRMALQWMVLAFWGATAAFYLLARFRIGFLPLLCVAAAGGIREIAVRLRACRDGAAPRESRRRLAIAVAVLLLAFYVVDFAHGLYCESLMPAFFRQCRPAGLALEFPRERVVYDHGPLGFGGTAFAAWEKDRATLLEKSFVVPAAFQSASPIRQELLLRVTAPMLPAQALLQLDGSVIPAEVACRTERAAHWLSFRFTAPLSGNPVFLLQVTTSAWQPEWGFAVDFQRDYGRTRLMGEALCSEAVMELVLPQEALPPGDGTAAF